MNSDFWFGIVGLVVGVSTALIGASKYRRELRVYADEQIEREKQRYAEAEVKRYAAERDFNHLARDFEQLKVGQATLFKEIQLDTDRLSIEIGKVSQRLDDMEKLIRAKL